MGYAAYQRVNQMAESFTDATRPDDYLLKVKDIFNLLTTAEGKVTEFSLTGDSISLSGYNPLLRTIDIKKAELEEVYTGEKYVDTILSLIDRKTEALDELILAADTGYNTLFRDFTERIEEYSTIIITEATPSKVPNIDPIQKTVPNESTNEQVDETEDEKKGKGFLGGIFNRKKNREKKNRKNKNQAAEDLPIPETPVIIKEPTPPPVEAEKPRVTEQPNYAVRKLKREAIKLGRKDRRETDEERQRRMELTQIGQESMDALKGYMDILEKAREERAIKLADDADAQANDTNQTIQIFGATVVGLISLLIVVIFQDIARNLRLRRNLQEEKARAESLAKAKEDFLANMSHEIRTPMNAVIGFAEQLDETRLSHQQRRLLTPIRNSANYLLALINDILDYSKLESGKFALEQLGFSLNGILTEVIDTFQLPARQKNIALHLEKDPMLPPFLKGDPLRLRQMLFNLLGNALKFTAKGSVTLAVAVLEQDDQAVTVEFKVIDTGIGIPKSQLKNIFADFVQADNSTTRRYGGTGLGLSITRKLADLHGGGVQLESEVNQGTTAILHLAFATASDADVEQQVLPQAVNRKALHGMKVLVADDEPYNRELIGLILEKWQVEAHIVNDGAQAIAALDEKSFDFLLLDLRMPEADGMTVARVARQQLKLEVPIIALTATSTSEEIARALESGFDAHLLKPFQERELFQLLVKLLKIEVEEHTGYEVDKLARMTNQDQGAMRHMLSLFVKTTQDNLAGLHAALAGEDWKNLAMKAHRMVPPCRHLGLENIVLQLKEIEYRADHQKDLDRLPPLVEATGRQIQAVVDQIETDLASEPAN
ncbi:MAG: ATP-binding protein [Bacteroidota bacterium]